MAQCQASYLVLTVRRAKSGGDVYCHLLRPLIPWAPMMTKRFGPQMLMAALSLIRRALSLVIGKANTFWLSMVARGMSSRGTSSDVLFRVRRLLRQACWLWQQQIGSLFGRTRSLRKSGYLRTVGIPGLSR